MQPSESGQEADEIVQVPVITFREFAKVIADNDLWAEIIFALRENGFETVPVGHRQLEVISNALNRWAAAQADDSGAGRPAVVPECASNKYRPTKPQFPEGGAGDGGVQE